MGRNCCCGEKIKPPLYCDPLNCPLCSCVGTEENPVPEEIKYKDFLTAKYTIDGFRDIVHSASIGGSGGNITFINEDYKNNPLWATHLGIPIVGSLTQYYDLEVTGLQALNGQEFEFDLVNDDNIGCIYKPKIECLIPYGEVIIKEKFEYLSNLKAHAYIAPVWPVQAGYCCSKYALEHRGCWYESPVTWYGTIGYEATYKLYVKLNAHRAISSTYQETKTPECSENPNSENPPPCTDFPNCDICLDHPLYTSINGAIEIYLVLQSCTPILAGDEDRTGKYVRHYRGGGSEALYVDFEITNSCPINLTYPKCLAWNGCVSEEGDECLTILKYKYAECKQPFNHGYAYGWNSLLDHTDNQYIYLHAGRVGLSDVKTERFHQNINGVNEYLLGREYFNWKNFSFLKQIPFIPPVNFSGSVKYFESECCPTFIDILTEKCKTSIIKIPISICSKENICYTYDSATEELSDTYKIYGLISSFEQTKMPREKDCEDNVFDSDWRKILRCSDFTDTDPECETEGTGRFAGFNLFYTNDLLPYLFRNDRHLYVGNGQYICPDNEDYFKDPETSVVTDKIYCFKPYTYQERPFKNLIRHAIFGIDNAYYYWSNYATRFFYSVQESPCNYSPEILENCPDGIELITKYYPCRSCICFNDDLVPPFGQAQAMVEDDENKNLNPNNPEPPPPNPPHDPDPPNQPPPNPNDPNPPPLPPPSPPFPPPPPPLPPPNTPIPNPNPNPPPPSPPSLPDCICNGSDTHIQPTISQFEADWSAMDQVSSVYTYVKSLDCVTDIAFIVPKPWDLKLKVVYK